MQSGYVGGSSVLSQVMEERKSVKLFIDGPDFGESLWALTTEREGVYELDNSPLNDVPYTSGDLVAAIVRDDGWHHITGVVEKRYEPYCFEYAGEMCGDNERGAELRREVREYLEAHGCRVEWLIAGVSGLSVPIRMSEAEIEAMLSGSPYPITIATDDKDDE